MTIQNQEPIPIQTQLPADGQKSAGTPNSNSDPEPQSASPGNLPLPDTPVLQTSNSNGPQEMIITVAGHVVAANPSGFYVDGSSVDPDKGPLTIPRVTETNQGNSAALGNQIATVPIRPPTIDPASIYSPRLTAGGPPILVSGMEISLDASSDLIFGDYTPAALAPTSGTPSTVDPIVGVQIATLNGETIPLLSKDVAIAGATLTPSAPPTIISTVLISIGPSAILIGTDSFPLASEHADLLVTTVSNQAITIDPTGVEVAGATLTPGEPGVTASGTLISLDSAGELVLGSRTVTLQSPSEGLGGLIMGGFESHGPFATTSPSQTTGNSSARAGNGTSSSVQSFEGKAEKLECSLLARLIVTLTIVVLLFAPVC